MSNTTLGETRYQKGKGGCAGLVDDEHGAGEGGRAKLIPGEMLKRRHARQNGWD